MYALTQLTAGISAELSITIKRWMVKVKAIIENDTAMLLQRKYLEGLHFELYTSHYKTTPIRLDIALLFMYNTNIHI